MKRTKRPSLKFGKFFSFASLPFAVLKLSLMEINYRVHLRIRYLHDLAYKNNKTYKKYSDSPMSKHVHRATATAFAISFIVLTLAQIGLPNIFNFGAPNKALAGANNKNWTTHTDFSNSTDMSNLEVLGLDDAAFVKLQSDSFLNYGNGSDGELILDGTSANASSINGVNIVDTSNVMGYGANYAGPFNASTPLVLDLYFLKSNNTYNFTNVTLRNNAVLTHSVMSGPKGGVEGIELYATGTVDIQSGSSIDVSGKSNKTTGTGGTGSGGSYGNLGGSGSGAAAQAYGDSSTVAEMGSKGGDGYNSLNPLGGKGGGRFKLVGQSIDIGGTIQANGAGGQGISSFSSGQHAAGGGSGGGIYLASANLSISNSISAAGGGGGSVGTGTSGSYGLNGTGGNGGTRQSTSFTSQGIGGGPGLAGVGGTSLSGSENGGSSAGGAGSSYYNGSSRGGGGGGAGRIAIYYSNITQGNHQTINDKESSVLTTPANWSEVSGGSFSGGSTKQTSTQNASFSYTLTSAYSFNWLATKATGRGRASVVFNGEPAVTVDLHLPQTMYYDEGDCYDGCLVNDINYQQNVFSKNNLDPTQSYSVTITALDASKVIDIDKFVIRTNEEGFGYIPGHETKVGPYSSYKSVFPYRTSGDIGGINSIRGLRLDAGVSRKAGWSSVDYEVDGNIDLAGIQALQSGQKVKFLIKVSNDASSWTIYDRNGAVVSDLNTAFNSAYYGVAFGDVSAYKEIHSNVPETRYAEVLVRLESDGTNVQALNSVTLKYDTLDAPNNSNVSLKKSTDASLMIIDGSELLSGQAGGYTNESIIKISASGLTCNGCVSTERRVEVEAKPIGTAFNESGLVAGNSIDNGDGSFTSTASITGLSAGAYHVRLRTIDLQGKASEWLSYGGNVDGVADFTIDQNSPTGTVVVNSNAQFTTSNLVNLTISGSDTGGSGLAQMRLSNDGQTWYDWENYSSSKSNWDLTQLGGTAGDGEKKVYIQFKDNAGNISQQVQDYSFSTFEGGSLTSTYSPGGKIILGGISSSATLQHQGYYWYDDDYSSVCDFAHGVTNGSLLIRYGVSDCGSDYTYGEHSFLRFSNQDATSGTLSINSDRAQSIVIESIPDYGTLDTSDHSLAAYSSKSFSLIVGSNNIDVTSMVSADRSASPQRSTSSFRIKSSTSDAAQTVLTSPSLLLSQLTPYQPSGIFISRFFNSGIENPRYGSFYPVYSKAEGVTNISFKIRGGDMANLSDAPAWDMAAVIAPGDIIPESIQGKQYIQYQATLTTSDNTKTPVLDDVFIEVLNKDFDTITLDTQPPAQPTNLKLYSDNTKNTEYNQTTWYNDNNVYLEWTDDNEVVDYKYCVDSINTCTPNTSLGGNSYATLDLSARPDGAQKIRISGTDAATNVSTIATFNYNMDMNVPGAVTGLTASTNDLTRILLSWNSANTGSPLDHYILERVKYSSFESNLWDNNSNWSTGDGYATFTLTSTTFTDDSNAPVQSQTPIEQSVKYVYRIKVKDVANTQYSPYQTNTITGLTRDGLPPTDPTGVDAVACDGTLTNCSDIANKGFEIKLTWNPSTDSGTGVSKYYIYRAKSAPDDIASYTKIGEATSPIFYDNDSIHADPANRLNDYSTYYYRITALDNAVPTPNESNLLPAFDPTLNLDSATTPDVTAPSIPTDVTASALGIDSSGEKQKVQITWSASNDLKSRSTGLGSGVKEYLLYKAISENGPYTYLATTPANTLEYVEEGLEDFTYYYYKVAAVDNSNNPTDPTTRQSVLSSVRTASSAVPTVPTNVLVTAKKGNPSDPEVGKVIDVVFKGSYAKYYRIVKYELYRSTTNYSSASDWLNPAKATLVREYNISPIQDDRDTLYTHKDTNLTDATAYYYKVRAIDNTPADPDGGPFASGFSVVTLNTPTAGWDITPDVTAPVVNDSVLEVNVKDTHPNEFELRNIVTWKMLTNSHVPRRVKHSYDTCQTIATVDGIQYCSDFAKYEVHRETIDPNNNNVLSDVVVAEKTTLNDNYFIDIVQIAFKDSKFRYYVQVVDDAGSNFRYPNNNLVNATFSNKSQKVYWAESIIPSKSKPVLVGGVTLSNIQVASAEVNWVTDQEADSLVQYRTKGSNESWVTVGQIERTTTHKVKLFGLKPLTEYEYQIVSRNYLGNNVENYGTLPNLKTAGFNITMGKTETTTTGAEINWTTNLDADSAFVEYQMNRQPGDDPQGKTVGVNPNDIVAKPRDHKVVIQGLKSSRTYTFKIKSISKDGFVAESNFETFTTRSYDSGQFTLTPSSSNVAERNITATTAQIVWQTATPTTSWVDYSTTSGKYDNSAGDNNLNTQHAVMIEGLIPGTKYFYRVRAKDANDIEYTSQEYSFTAVLKPKIENLRVSEVTPYSFILEWTTNVDTETLINLGTSAAYGEKRGVPGLRKQHKVLVEGLTDNTEYHYQILAKDEMGNEVADSDKFIRTPLDTEGPQILNVKTDVLPIGAEEAGASVIISWQTNKPSTTMVEYDEGIIGGRYTFKSIEDKTLNLSHSVILKDLKPASSYHFKIVSRDKRGNLGQSPDHTFVTPTKEKSILQLILKSLEETFAWTKNVGNFFGNVGKRAKGK